LGERKKNVSGKRGISSWETCEGKRERGVAVKKTGRKKKQLATLKKGKKKKISEEKEKRGNRW